MKNEDIVRFIKDTFNSPEEFIPLHAPLFKGKEREYVMDAIDSTFVSSVGAYVTRFEDDIRDFTGAGYAVAIVNGTAALHLALIVANVQPGDEVITQPLSFVATANSIVHAGAQPVFVDVDQDTLGMSPSALEAFLQEHTYLNPEGRCINRLSGATISACVPMHTFGFPLRIDAIASLCEKYHITLVEDAAESLGSDYNGKHTGNFGKLGVFSFNGNKTITCGGGGAIITNDEALARKAKHLSTTAKIPHAWEFVHDEVAYNYRMPNLNAALACAQLEELPDFLENKRSLASLYEQFFAGSRFHFVTEPSGTRANYWLNTLLLNNIQERDAFLIYTNGNNVMTRPAWQLINTLPMYKHCISGELPNARWLADRIVNLPSSVRHGK